MSQYSLSPGPVGIVECCVLHCVFSRVKLGLPVSWRFVKYLIRSSYSENNPRPPDVLDLMTENDSDDRQVQLYELRCVCKSLALAHVA
jgi:hypothetical protein